MTPRVRKFALTAHVVFSVGWLGAVMAYLPLAVAGLTSSDDHTARAVYPAMELVSWCAVVPCSLMALLTGLVQSLGTEWGLFRYYWVVVKFLLTVAGTTVLLLHMPAVAKMSRVAAETPLSRGGFGMQRTQLVLHASGGLLVLLTVTALSVYKPWGRTGYGRETRGEGQEGPRRRLTRPLTRAPWGLYVLLGIAGLVMALAALHLAGGHASNHWAPPVRSP